MLTLQKVAAYSENKCDEAVPVEESAASVTEAKWKGFIVQ